MHDKVVVLLCSVINSNFVSDDVEIWIRHCVENGIDILARGHWYDEKVQDYWTHEVESITFSDDNLMLIDVK